MTNQRRWQAALLVGCGLLLSGCATVAEGEEAINEPATLEAVDGTEVSRITLTEQAADRVDIKTGSAREAGAEVVIPYAALFYTASGDTWTYTNPEPLTFVRVPVVVDRIRGARAFLTSGPPAGMAVVTQGAVELYGTETDVEE